MTTAIADNTVLSNFAHAEKAGLLREAFDRLVAPSAVMEELAEGVRLGRVPAADWSWLPIIEMTDEEQMKAIELGQTLGRGEAECIALAQSRAWVILTDDWDARRAATNAGVLVSGTLGALMNLVRAEIMSIAEGDIILARMKQHGYRCSIDSLTELDESE